MAVAGQHIDKLNKLLPDDGGVFVLCLASDVVP